MATGGSGSFSSCAPKKKQRFGSTSSLSSTMAVIDGSVAESYHKSPGLRRFYPQSIPGGFNDSTTANVILGLHLDHPDTTTDDNSEIQIYLHSDVICCRSKYFAALLSDRWLQSKNSVKTQRVNLSVPSTNSISHYITVLQLLYSDDLSLAVDSVSAALNCLPIALELLFEDCIKACVKFLEAVPWSEDEEQRILNLVPSLGSEESKELLARLSPATSDLSEEMLYRLILSTTNHRTNMAFAKAFVAKLLRDFTSKVSVRKVLDKAFERTLRMVKVALEEYSSPNLRDAETEAIQRGNLQTAMTCGKHLLWLVERMIELNVADSAVKAWSEQTSFTKDLLKMLDEDVWRTTVPSLPSVLLRCSSRIASAVATGNFLATRQVRMKIVTDWLPVLTMCKDSGSSMGSNHKSLHLELEQTFLKIISTLPMSDARDLLEQCLSFSTRNIDDCSHLVAAFTTWFRRANRPQQTDFSE